MKGLTELVFILDRSGSMSGLESDTIGGFNGMIEKQKHEEGDALVSTILFDHEVEILHDRISLQEVQPITDKEYFVRGTTALLDAIGSTIQHIAKIHKYIRAEDRPEHTLFVITTDGLENASRQYTLPQVKEMVEKEQSKYGWEFLFLGANMDAIKTAGQFGIRADRAVTYCSDSEGTALNYKTVNAAVSKVRSARPLSAAWKDPIEADMARRQSEQSKGSKKQGGFFQKKETNQEDNNQ